MVSLVETKMSKKKKSQHLMGPLDHNFHLDLVTTKADIMT